MLTARIFSDAGLKSLRIQFHADAWQTTVLRTPTTLSLRVITKMTSISEQPADNSHDPATSSPTRISVIESLVPIAVNEAAEQLEVFTERLGDAMFRLSDQTVRPNEANLSFNAYNHLKKNATQLHRGIVGALSTALLREIASLEKSFTPVLDLDQPDLSLVSLDEMENKVLIGNIGQTIELDNSTALVALNIRLSRLLQRQEISIAQNPFRPAVFVRAVFDAWCKFDTDSGAERLVLRLFRPDVFLDFDPIFSELNRALVARGIVPDLAEVYRTTKRSRKPPVSPEAERRDASMQNKLQRWLEKVSGEPAGKAAKSTAAGTATGVAKNGGSRVGASGENAGYEGGNGGWSRSGSSANGSSNHGKGRSRQVPQGAGAADGATSEALLRYLSEIQRNALDATGNDGTPAFAQTAATLRHIPRQAPSGSMTALDQNTVELLARIFDFVFSDPNIPDEIKRLLGQLQVPLLKTALLDKEFFFSETHPARRLLDCLAQSGIGMGQEIAADDPLFQMIEQIVDRVQQEFDQQLELYSDVVADLEAFLIEEERTAKTALKTSIAEALREEKMVRAREMAEKDVSTRIETGEVAGFVEVFLETQWTRILTLAHGVSARKPEALEKALKAMDDLIWSVKPKVSPEERKELVSKLPALLSLINAWLNAVKWDDPARVEFFSNLVERHAAIVRNPTELSPRHQLELAVNVAQKASERRLSKRAREMQEQPIDQFVHIVDSLEVGGWVEFTRHNGVHTAFRLAWISPLRSRFIFSNRQSDEPFSFTAEELAKALREQGAVVMARESVITRALAAALNEVDPGS